MTPSTETLCHENYTKPMTRKVLNAESISSSRPNFRQAAVIQSSSFSIART